MSIKVHIKNRFRPLFRTCYDSCFRILKHLPINVTIRIQSKKCGFFGDLYQTLSAIRFFEQIGLNCEVDWGKKSLYFDKKHGDNVWDYYFVNSKFSFSKKTKLKLNISYSPTAYNIRKYEGLSQKESDSIVISKFCKMKEEISNSINNYIEMNFSTNTLGVHYRGTDAMAGYEGRSAIEIDLLVSEINNYIDEYKDAKIFLATDDYKSLKILNAIYKNQMHYTNSLRSLDGISVHGHFDKGVKGSGYQKGYDALLDAFLLSRCNFLIHKGSQLAKFALLKNLSLKNIDI